MRSIKTVALVAATMLLIPQMAAAANLDTEVQEMKQRLQEMENQLQAQDQELAAAKEDRTVVSVLSSFLEKTDITGFVAAGFNWSKNRNHGGFYPGGPTVLSDQNTFQLDQAWIELSKTPTDESRAGFNIALESGAWASQGGNWTSPGTAPGSNRYDCYITGCGDADQLSLFTANVSYLAPLGDGLLITAGIMATALGAEVEQQNGNWQITRGLVWGIQPVTNTGVTMRYSITDSLSVMVGALNDPIADQRFDTNKGKGLTSQVSFAADKFSLNAGVNWGSQKAAGNVCGSERANELLGIVGGTFECESEGILDIVATITPTDRLSFWANYDYAWTKGGAGGEGHINALAVAGRVGILKHTGISARWEWLEEEVEFNDVSVFGKLRTWEITATLDHQITDGLIAKAEYRYDREYFKDGNGHIGINTVLVQMLYQF